MAKRYDRLLRLLLVGNTGVGKTCLLCRFCSDDFFSSHISTIGIDFKMKTLDVDGRTVKAQIWDTAGQERFESITKQFYRRAQGILLVYDICSRSSFVDLSKWLNYIKQFALDDVSLMVIGNKCDQDRKRKVSLIEGQQFAKEKNMIFFETSAKSRDNIDRAFRDICGEILRKQAARKIETNGSNGNVHIGSNSGFHPDDTPLIDKDDDENLEDTSDLSHLKLAKKWTCCYLL